MFSQSIYRVLYEHCILSILTLFLSAAAANAFYELAINPLKKYKGPKLAAITRIPFFYHSMRGNFNKWISNIHVQYGDVVRVAPDELSYSSGEAWKDIYGHGAAGKKSTNKDLRFYGPTFNGAPDIIRANGPDHARFRRNFSNAFSDKALREQQPLIGQYVDMFIDCLNTITQQDPDRKIEMVRLFNLTTFDIMGDLTFGESLDLLAGTGDDNWVTAIFASVKASSLRRMGRYATWMAFFVQKSIPETLKIKSLMHYSSCMKRVDKRIDASHKAERPDIWGLVMNQKEELQLSKAEMYANSQIFMLAGTETTATALSGLTYQLLMNPEKLETITKEIRETFQKDSDIGLIALGQMKYLNACIDEGLRIYPPVPIGLPRLAPSGGMVTAVSVNHWATYRNPRNFQRPNEFLPERWLSSEFVSDNKSAFQPFSFGPRNCLGKNLAYHEMRIILAKFLYNFDLTLTPESVGWAEQKVYGLWQKNKLMVQLKPRAT
ncbi:hypothetical protein N7478_013346 [Penicillium angulare]|uniref:uncharacterized protein n=1 Tax=Penicillium angulare TaxID=116970 RepID=UPI00253FF5CB|nr:uncharacterized protein N7478_013346 [Penicillium angulare]KAJ5257242.1 hypothetical protein N7478_013346 [Penicillium angulare]